MEFCVDCIELHCIEEDQYSIQFTSSHGSVRLFPLGSSPGAKEGQSLLSFSHPAGTGVFTRNFLSLSHPSGKMWELQRSLLSGFCVTTGPLRDRRHFGPWQSLQIPVKRKMDLYRYPSTCSLFILVVFFPSGDSRAGRRIRDCINTLTRKRLEKALTLQKLKTLYTDPHLTNCSIIYLLWLIQAWWKGRGTNMNTYWIPTKCQDLFAVT